MTPRSSRADPVPRVERPAEDDLRDLHRAGSLRAMAALALERYGAELLSFCFAVLRSEQAAEEAFAAACEDIWRGLTHFRWDSSFRVWAYTLTRHACARYRRDPWRRRAAFAVEPWLSDLEAHVRTETLPHLRTTVKDRLFVLRNALSAEEQMLLTLRIDRGLEWTDVAQVLSDSESPIVADELRRRAAACRKRFERLTRHLRELARAEGLLDG